MGRQMGRREILNKAITDFPGRTVGNFRMLLRKGHNFKKLTYGLLTSGILHLIFSDPD